MELRRQNESSGFPVQQNVKGTIREDGMIAEKASALFAFIFIMEEDTSVPSTFLREKSML